MLFPKYKITSGFGPRTLENGDSRPHNGIDVVGIGSTQVLSPVRGEVVRSRIVTDKSQLVWEFGNYVAIRSSDGYTHYFCHLAERDVNVGDIVGVGAVIGIMGNTGYSKGVHVHYGIKDTKQIWIDPMLYHKSNKDKVKERFSFDDNTIKFLSGHPFADALFEKLATKK